MERIDKLKLQGKTPEEALPLIEKWINETAERANFAMTHLDEKNFIEGKQPVMQQELQENLEALWQNVKKLVSNN